MVVTYTLFDGADLMQDFQIEVVLAANFEFSESEEESEEE